MVKAIMHGCNGRMGQMITSIAAEDPEIEIVAGIDIVDREGNPYPVFHSIDECDVKADVIIDFGNPNAIDKLLDYCESTKTAVVLCTTGLSTEQLERIEKVSNKCAVLKSANMSVGINLISKILKDNSKVLKDAGFDIEIVEKHHRMKLDAPSGTALALADAVKEGLNEDVEYVFDRSTRRMKRPDDEIGISAVRGGSIVGDHDVIFAGTDEVITFSHTAYSRAVFAKGAIAAAKFIYDKRADYYTMSDVVK